MRKVPTKILIEGSQEMLRDLNILFFKAVQTSIWSGYRFESGVAES